MHFTLHTTATAPEASRPMLSQVATTYGSIPNLYAEFAESPVALSTYVGILAALKDHAILTPQEQQIVMLLVSERNRCEYCVAAHSMVATMNGVSAETVAALRNGDEPGDEKQAALARFTAAVVAERGWVTEMQQQDFLAAGYTPRHALDVLSIMAMKTLSNYTNHLADTPLDPAFAGHRWSAPV